MAEIIWSKRALDDLDEIAEFVALSNPKAAKKLTGKILHSVDRLELFPKSGRIPPENFEYEYREIVVNPCRIFYKYDGNNVHILNVVRQERDLRNYLIQESKTEYVVE